MGDKPPHYDVNDGSDHEAGATGVFSDLWLVRACVHALRACVVCVCVFGDVDASVGMNSCLQAVCVRKRA